MSEDPSNTSRIDRLIDAIELIEADQRDSACDLLRQLIREDNDFEDAWLWMSVAVDSMDQSTLCLDNVLRINPGNVHAAGALYRLRESEMRMEHKRARLRTWRDLAFTILWLLIIGLSFAALFTYA